MAVGKDTLRRFIFEGEDILGSIVRLDDVWDTLRTADNYPSQIEPLVGEAAAAAALLGRSLKFDGRLTFQVQGAEHLRLLVMQTDNKLNLRGIARYGDKLPEYFTELVEGGLLTITIESDGLGGKAERYQSVVPLSEKTLADCLGVYYRQSVQLPTVLLLDASNQRAAGLMLQAMPERKPGSGRWKQLVEELKGMDVLRMSGLDDSALLSVLFPEDDIRLFTPEPVAFRCDCSDQRIENMLRMFGVDELSSLASDPGPVEIRCEFCNKGYEVSGERMGKLIAEVSPSASGPLH